MQKTIMISSGLWLLIPEYEDFNGGLFYLRDNAGGEVLIDKEEIPALIEALQSIQSGNVKPEEAA